MNFVDCFKQKDFRVLCIVAGFALMKREPLWTSFGLGMGSCTVSVYRLGKKILYKDLRGFVLYMHDRCIIVVVR